MNTDLLNRVESKERERTLKMLKALVKRIEKGQLVPMEHGFWQGTQGKWNFHVVTRESEDFRPFTEL